MELDKETLHFVTQTTLPYAKALFDTYIVPAISEKLRAHKKHRELEVKVRKALHIYLSDAYAQCAYVSTIAFQNAPKRLLDIYVPLDLIQQADQMEIEVNEHCQLLEEHPSVLIVDNAGMGKSVIARRLALQCILNEKRVPVVIDLRSYSEDTDFVSDLLSALGLDSFCDEKTLSHLALALVFDGLDEVPLGLRKQAAKAILALRKLCTKAHTVVTSRPDQCTRLLTGFELYSVKNLSREKAISLLKKYDGDGALARKLISGIKSDTGGHIQDFLTTPLYVSLLYCAYRFKPVLPRRKHLFYSEVYDALFETHDLSKEPGFVHQKYSALDSADFHCVLRRLAFWCLSHDLRLEFLRDELELTLKHIADKTPGVHFRATDFVKDLVETVPLFVKEGNKLRWAHKALMEYFAAMFISHDANQKQEQILRKLYTDKNASSYLSVLELCADINYAAFRKSVAVRVLRKLRTHSERVLKVFSESKLSKRAVQDRAGLTFDRTIAIRTKGAARDKVEDKERATGRPEFLVHGASGPAQLLHGLYKDASVAKRLMRPVKGYVGVAIHIRISQDQPSSIVACSSGIDAEILAFLEDKEPGLFGHPQDAGKRGTEKPECNFPQDAVLFVSEALTNPLNKGKMFAYCNQFLKEVVPRWPDIVIADAIVKEVEEDMTCGLQDLLTDLV